mmetsp:Transcript_14152/g.40335  ORF Transcript_14152/g.40335 Transcript_14152/m.40335 type:complete len:226 (-) Transcript_14152:208-885(-)
MVVTIDGLQRHIPLAQIGHGLVEFGVVERRALVRSGQSHVRFLLAFHRLPLDVRPHVALDDQGQIVARLEGFRQFFGRSDEARRSDGLQSMLLLQGRFDQFREQRVDGLHLERVAPALGRHGLLQHLRRDARALAESRNRHLLRQLRAHFLVRGLGGLARRLQLHLDGGFGQPLQRGCVQPGADESRRGRDEERVRGWGRCGQERQRDDEACDLHGVCLLLVLLM